MLVIQIQQRCKHTVDENPVPPYKTTLPRDNVTRCWEGGGVCYLNSTETTLLYCKLTKLTENCR